MQNGIVFTEFEPTAPSGHLSEGGIAAAVGQLVRSSRAKRGMTRRQLSQASGTSERYLAQIEGGEGNPSVVILSAIASALEVPITDLLPRVNGRPAAMSRILDLLARVPALELTMIADLIERRAGAPVAGDRGRRVALIGLRGAGKSTLGRKLAAELGSSFPRSRPSGRAGLRRAPS